MSCLCVNVVTCIWFCWLSQNRELIGSKPVRTFFYKVFIDLVIEHNCVVKWLLPVSYIVESSANRDIFRYARYFMVVRYLKDSIDPFTIDVVS